MFARESGLPDIIVQGSLKSAFLGQLVTEWAGAQGVLCELSVQYRGLDIPAQALSARGRVVGTRVEGERCLVDCEVWLEGQAAQPTT